MIPIGAKKCPRRPKKCPRIGLRAPAPVATFVRGTSNRAYSTLPGPSQFAPSLDEANPDAGWGPGSGRGPIVRM
jgi:hypothetical protein